MRTIWRGLIGRFWYRVDVAEKSGRWMMIREHEGEQDEECVVRGREVRTTPRHILDVAVEELEAIVEELRDGQEV